MYSLFLGLFLIIKTCVYSWWQCRVWKGVRKLFSYLFYGKSFLTRLLHIYFKKGTFLNKELMQCILTWGNFTLCDWSKNKKWYLRNLEVNICFYPPMNYYTFLQQIASWLKHSSCIHVIHILTLVPNAKLGCICWDNLVMRDRYFGGVVAHNLGTTAK